jgi:hypothetical protein
VFVLRWILQFGMAAKRDLVKRIDNRPWETEGFGAWPKYSARKLVRRDLKARKNKKRYQLSGESILDVTLRKEDQWKLLLWTG